MGSKNRDKKKDKGKDKKRSFARLLRDFLPILKALVGGVAVTVVFVVVRHSLDAPFVTPPDASTTPAPGPTAFGDPAPIPEGPQTTSPPRPGPAPTTPPPVLFPTPSQTTGLVSGTTPLAAPGTGLAGYVLGGRHVLYVDGSQHVQELWLGTGASTWKRYDQTVAASAPLAARNSGLAGYALDGTNHAAYVDEQGHVRMLEWDSKGAKPPVDLTASAGAPPASAGTGLAAYTLGGPHVLYIDVDRHVQALWIGSGGSRWENYDHTALAGAPPAARNSGLAGYALNGINYAAYVDELGHVSRLEWTTTTRGPIDLMVAAGAPVAVPGTGLAGYVVGGQHVLYVDGQQHVQELWLGNGASTWIHFDQTAAAKAPLAAAGSGLAGYTLNGINYAAYVDAQGHVRGLEWTSAGPRPSSDLSA